MPRSTDAERVVVAGRPETIRTAVSLLRDGGVIAVPTDTVYGLVTLFDDEPAIRKIFEIKGRPPDQPLPVLLGSAADLPLVTGPLPSGAWPLIYAFWPGPLTIILRSSRSVSPLITARTNTIGVRVPAHSAVLDLLEAVSLPFASTSANRHGRPSALATSEVATSLGADVDLIVDPENGSLTGTPSTVVDLTLDRPLVRRQGSVTPNQIREAMGARIDVSPMA